MTIGLKKNRIIEILKENEDVVSEELIEKIALVIIENNKAIENDLSDMALKSKNKGRSIRI
ncbi:hypothetical protein AB3Z07_05040 [Metabacillus halosaccharovorans]|uniref:hypothetical protein n=1 Tax=Metabacillus halosaccharovorans TaxID=930124 RepID=UPI0034CF2D09